MNYMKTRFFLMACAVIVLCGCQSNEPEQASEKGLSFEVFSQSSSAQRIRRVHTDGKTLTTTFAVGDKAGVFAIHDGKVLSQVDNLCLTLNASGIWVPSRVVPYTDEYAQAQFYAYFPYRESVAVNPGASDPFEAVRQDYVVPADQSTADKFASADLMTSAACVMNELRAVKLPLQHRMALVNMELPNRSYIFTNADIEPYVVVAPTNVLFMLGEKEVKPFFDENTQSYMLVIKPETEQTLAISYDNAGKTHQSEITTLANIWSGEYASFSIDGGADIRTHTLQQGDFMLADGGLLSKDATDAEVEAVKADIVGVVYQIGTTEAIQTDFPNCKHAVVLALTETGAKSKWGDKVASPEYVPELKDWWTAYGLTVDKENEIKDPASTTLIAKGYENTKAWLSIPKDMLIANDNGDVYLANTKFHDTYAAWSQVHPLPEALTTDWFVPSLREWLNISDAGEAIATSLSRAGGNSVLTDEYWSCNLRSDKANKTVTMWAYESNLSPWYIAKNIKDNCYYRLIFAF